jgi:alpha-methylacyl-CoA racemase
MTLSYQPLLGIRVVTMAVNVPGPAACARMVALGAHVQKIEPPSGDPLAGQSPAWYAELSAGQQVARVDLKSASGRADMQSRLADCDIFLTSHRPSALARLGLDWETLHARHPRLCQVAITGFPPPDEEVAGHDLTYLAAEGLLAPPAMPRTLMADLAGADQAVNAAMGLLLQRHRAGGSGYVAVPLSEAARWFSQPYRHGMTRPGGQLSGVFAGYNVYPARSGWVAVAALEPHFWAALMREAGRDDAEPAHLAAFFATRDAAEWEAWALARDLPITALRGDI